MNRSGKDFPLTIQEREALEHASEQAGAYLETLGKTDMAQFEVEEWKELVEGICLSFADYIRDRAQEADIPF